MSRVLVLFVLISACAIGPAHATAQGSTPATEQTEGLLAFEIFPKGKLLGDYFEPEIGAGNSVDLVVVLANTGTVKFSGRTYANNAFSGVNGGFAVADRGSKPNEVTLWLDYPEDVYSIDPGEGVERTFSITVPDNAQPGQYLTSLILEDAESRSVAGSQNFEQLIRFAVPVFITVPGPVDTGFEIEGTTLSNTSDASELTVTISNIGDVLVRPTGTVTVSREDGEILFEAPIGMGSVYARESTSLVVGFPTLVDGTYRIRIALEDLGTNTTAESATIIPISDPATPPPAPPIQFIDASAAPRPSAENPQFIDVSVSIENTGDSISNGRLTLRVSKDGESVEDYPIASSLSIASGSTIFQERYIPAEGWSTGTWEFTISLEAVEPGSGVARILATAELDAVVVP